MPGAPESSHAATDESQKPLFRGWLHLVATIAALIAGPIVVSRAPSEGTRVGLVIYAVSLVALFGVSASYHRGRWSPSARQVVRRVDHTTVFFAIAGTYSAVAELALFGWARVTVLVLVWGGTVAGVGVSQLWLHAPKRVVAMPYVVVGWSALAVLPQMERGLGATGFVLIIVGGLAYTAGAVVYALRRPDPIPTVFGFHEVFHALTIIGAVLQYIAIISFAIPRA